jgi:hypothetical protein
VTRTALFVRWVLGVSAAVFLALGLVFILRPLMMLGALDIKAEPGKALADIRAVYGGLDLAIGILLIYYFVRRQWATGLGISALVCVCLAIGRLVGILIDPATDILTFGLFASEVLGAVLSAVALFLARQPEPTVVAVETAAPVAVAPTTPVTVTPTTPESITTPEV